jgi:WD40 repeat protein
MSLSASQQNGNVTLPLPSARRRSFWRRAMDAVFGYDLFISYAWRDGTAYAVALTRRLETRGFEVFLDRDDYASGDDWKQVGAWTLRRTGQLILVGSAGALASAPVAREVTIFGGTGRRIVPIDFDGSLDNLPANSPLSPYLEDEIIRVREAPDALAAGPTDEVVSTLCRTFTLLRQDKKRLRIMLGVACILGALLVASAFLAVSALHQKAAADENAKQTFLRQADLSASIALRLFGEGRPVLGLKVARAGAPKTISDATPLTPRLALALSRGSNQIREEAELRHPDGNISNAVWSPDGSRAATSTLTDAPRVWNASNGELQATLGSGIRPDYFLNRDPSDLAFSGDGRRLATLLGDSVSVWDTNTWAQIFEIRCDPPDGRFLRLSPDGKSLAAQCKDGIHVWDIAAKRELFHRAEVVGSDGTMPWLGAFAFADDSQTLVLVDDRSADVSVLGQIGSGTAQFGLLKRISADIRRGPLGRGFASVHATSVPSEFVLRGNNGIFRVDVAQDRIVWQLAYPADRKHWFQMLRSPDAIATANLADDGDIEYRIAQSAEGTALYEGRLHFTGQNVDAKVNAVAFQDNGRGIAVALNTGVLVIGLTHDAKSSASGGLGAFPSGGLQILKGEGRVAFSGPCSGATAEARGISLLGDGARMIATCDSGEAHMVRLREPPPRLLGAQRIVRFGSAVMRLAWTGANARFETIDVNGAVIGQSDAIGEDLGYWAASETGSAAVLVGASGAVRSWRPGAPGFVKYNVELGDIRAARFDHNGSRVALLDKNGTFVRLRIDEVVPELLARIGGPVLPPIDFAIDPALSAVAFTTQDLNRFDAAAAKPPATIDDALAVVATPGADKTQFRCRHSQSSRYAAALFSETGQPAIYLVQRDRIVEKLAFSDNGALGSCPTGLADAFRPDLKWAINPFTHENICIVEATDPERPGRLIFGGAEESPLQLIDLASQRSVTDLTPYSGFSYPLAVSSDGRYLAAQSDTAASIDIFDVTTGSRLRRIRSEQAIASERGAAMFAHGDQWLVVRLASGVAAAYPLMLRDGAGLLEDVEKSSLNPLTDDEKREIYDFRQRFSRPAAAG